VALDASSVAIGVYPRDYAEGPAGAMPGPTPQPEFTQPGGAPGITQPGQGTPGAPEKKSKLGMIIGLSVGGAAIALTALVVGGVVLTRRYSRATKGHVLGAVGDTSVRQTDDAALLSASAASPMVGVGGGGASDNLTGRGRTLTGSSIGTGGVDSSAPTGGGAMLSSSASPLTSPAINRGASGSSRQSGGSGYRPQQQLHRGGASGEVVSQHSPAVRGIIDTIDRSSSGRPLYSPSAANRGLGR
jgi:hypothetical protein